MNELPLDIALSFLRQYQPMPPDRLIDLEIWDQYRKVVDFFEVEIDQRCIPLLLRSFGDGDCFGLYQIVYFTFLQYEESYVRNQILVAFSEELPEYTMAWIVQISINFLDRSFQSHYLEFLSSNNEDLATFAASGLSLLNPSLARMELTQRIRSGVQKSLEESFLEILNEL